MVDKALFSSDSAEWATPRDFFDKYNKDFGFTLDAAATHENALCDMYFTKDGLFFPGSGLLQICFTQDALASDSWGENQTIWLNPPYGRGVGAWIERASDERCHGNTTVMLLPARTDTRWFHDFIYRKENVEIDFIKGRLKFGGCENPAPFPSMAVVFRP
jgi:site-specific DNA-methyltransferase (adenine-specific)